MVLRSVIKKTVLIKIDPDMFVFSCNIVAISGPNSSCHRCHSNSFEIMSLQNICKFYVIYVNFCVGITPHLKNLKHYWIYMYYMGVQST